MINRDTIIKLAREAGLFTHREVQPEIERFAALIAQQEREACAAHYLDVCRKAIVEEREACAAICEEYDRRFDIPEVRWCAEDIRARGSA